MIELITPSGPLEGTVRLPGDKSISHRYAMLAALADGTSKISNYSSGADCHSTLACLRGLGIEIEVQDREVTVHGKGMRGFREPSGDLDVGNSGSAIRMLAGLLAAQPFRSRLIGDESVTRRPMGRIMTPLQQMGARLHARDEKFPPLVIEGGEVKAIDYTSPIASAQVKTCVLFAGLFAEGTTTVREPAKTRDHTEVALRQFGVEVETGRNFASITGPVKLEAKDLSVPGDISAAAFFLVAGAIVPGSNLVLQSVGLNPTRASLIDFLVSAGADIRILDMGMRFGEPVGDLQVRGSRLKGGTIDGALAASLIDEIPVISILGAVSENGLTVRDAAELRVKETDRIETVAANLRKMGVEIETTPDGFHIPGRQTLRGARVHSYGDHRIAMAFAVAGLRAEGNVEIEEAEAASVSFPEFWDTLRAIATSRE